jgi:hypothetical protein
VRPSLIGYFDLGESFGLSDEVFAATSLAPELDISLVGWKNPLGRGVRRDLLVDAPDALRLWRNAANAQIFRPAMETGWSEEWAVSREQFDGELSSSVLHHGITRCQLTIYAIGTVLSQLELASDMPDRQVQGVLRCFEYAAYTPQLSTVLYDLAFERAREAVGGTRTRLGALSRRDPPEVLQDSEGYEESRLFTSFTYVLLFVDEGDKKKLPDFLQTWHINASDTVHFEYHGRLHYSWPACLLEPRSVQTPTGRDQHLETPAQQIERMRACIDLAHVFLGTCEAMTRLFVGAIKDQAGGFVTRTNGRQPRELNRLRTLALAVNSLTSFDLVTFASEDRAYFLRFEADAEMARQRQLVSNASEILYSVQLAEQQSEDANREFVLNTVVFTLTTLTFLAVLISAYDFIRAQQELLRPRTERLVIFATAVLLFAILILVIVVKNRPGGTSRHQS